MLKRSSLLAFLVGGFLVLGAAPAGADTKVTAQLEESNGSGVTGTAALTATDDGSLRVVIHAEGHVPGVPHAQHIHGATTGTGHYMCPSMEADLDGDGLLTNEEASGEYGDVFMALTTEGDASAESGLAVDRMPVADSEGRLDYDRTFSADELPDGLVDQLEHVHVVQHGIDVNGNGEYDIDGAGVSTFAENLGVPDVPEEATDPASCGVVTGAMATRAPQGGVETGGGDADRLGGGRTCCRARSPAAHRVHGRPLAHQARPRPRVIAGTRAMKTLVASLVGLFGLVLLGALAPGRSERLVDPDRGRRRVHRHRHGRHPLQPDQRCDHSFDQPADHVDLADPDPVRYRLGVGTAHRHQRPVLLR